MRVGGDSGVWQMAGISYWTPEDGHKLVGDIEKTIGMPGGKERYWDEVPLTYCADHYTVHVRECCQQEPGPAPSFADLPNVLVTPHAGSATYETNLRMGMTVADNIIAVKNGVSPQIWSHLFH